MRKYMEELNTHTTKIVKKPPQTELDKPLSISVQNEIKLRKEEVKKTKKSKKLKKTMRQLFIFNLGQIRRIKKKKLLNPKRKIGVMEETKNKSGDALNVEQILFGLIIHFVILVIVKREKNKEKRSTGWADIRHYN